MKTRRSETDLLSTDMLFEGLSDTRREDVESAFAADPEGLEHGRAVAGILADLGMDQATILSAVLLPLGHTEEAMALLEDEPEIRSLVAGVSRLHTLPSGEERLTEAENLRRLLLALSDDVRVVMLALAERLQSMRELKRWPESERKAFAHETLNLFAPLANRLGIGQMKWEMEDLSLRFMEPQTYKEIARLLDEKRVDREEYIHTFVAELVGLVDRAGVQGEVYGRPKHIYSIWKKMQRKGIAFHDLYDVRAVRVLVEDVAQCYTVLGLVHATWQPIPQEFDDYIANPKPNNYQSLHTAVYGPDRKIVEIQIRTHEMHAHAELGVAAHWKYKEGGDSDRAFERRVNQLRKLLDNEEAQDDEALLESFQSADDEERIYVVTPRGKVVDLVHNATPVDFAYAIHTEVGHRCRGAKVNGHIVPLTYPLQNGETVEVLTAKEGGPSRDWLSRHSGYVKSSRARYRIRQYFRQLDMEIHSRDGQQSVEREIRRVGNRQVDMEQLYRRLHLDSEEALYVAVGRGDVSIGQLAAAIQDQFLVPESRTEEEQEAALVHRPSEASLRQPKRRKKPSHGIDVAGVGDLMTRMAECCKPVPGDPIIGFITRGAGVTIHRCDCPNVLNLSDEDRLRLIEVSWDGETVEQDDEEEVYPVDIVVDAYDRTGLLRDITAALSDAKINVIAVNTASNRDDHTARMTLTVEISGGEQLGRVLTKIGQLPNVSEVRRK